MNCSRQVPENKIQIPYPLECNPGLLFSVMGFWVGFYSNLSYLGLYSSWGSINYSLMGPEQTLQPLLLFIKFINFLLEFKAYILGVCDNISHFIGYVKNHFSLVNLKDQ